VLVDRVNTTATVWLGSTIGCAQCHNHKYDPFSQKEYYQLMAFFANSARDTTTTDASKKFKEPELDLATPEQEQARKKLKAEIDALEAKLKTQTPELGKGSVRVGAQDARISSGLEAGPGVQHEVAFRHDFSRGAEWSDSGERQKTRSARHS
jgi:hypothetical protein